VNLIDTISEPRNSSARIGLAHDDDESFIRLAQLVRPATSLRGIDDTTLHDVSDGGLGVSCEFGDHSFAHSPLVQLDDQSAHHRRNLCSRRHLKKTGV
jgi:hypothetical protein